MELVDKSPPGTTEGEKAIEPDYTYENKQMGWRVLQLEEEGWQRRNRESAIKKAEIALALVSKEEEKIQNSRAKAGMAVFTGTTKKKQDAMQAVAEESHVPEVWCKRREWNMHGECHLVQHAEGERMKTWQGMEVRRERE
jgi:hypothetical protein